MRNKIKVVSISLFILVLAMSFSCKKQKAGWKGKIDFEGEIKVVRNPDESFFGELNFDLEEDLTIGKEGDEKYMFYRVNEIELDSQGNIYVLDSGNQRVQKFDRNGNYLQTIGRKGQGPGEFESPFNMFLGGQDNLCVSEMRKIQIFNPAGEFIKSFAVPIFLLDFAVNSDGNVLANGFVRSEKGQNYGVVVIDSTGKIVRHISEFPAVTHVARGSSMFSLSHDYSPYLCFSPLNKKGVVCGYSPEYKLFFIDQAGNNFLIVKKDEPFHSISEKEKDKIINGALEDTVRDGAKWPRDVVEEAADFSKSRPFFKRILSDDKGRIYVSRLKSVLDKSEQLEFDIFSQDGYFLYTAKLPFTPEIIKDGFLYNIYSSEERGEVLIKRYKIRNWDQIKEGI